MSGIRDIDFTPEITFKTSRSGGKGGQHVNKVETKVELNFDVQGSQLLDQVQKDRITKKLENRITKEGILQVTSQAGRSQKKNKEKALEQFYNLLEEALKKKKKRKATKPPKSVGEKRLKKKKIQAEKKKLRGPIDP